MRLLRKILYIIMLGFSVFVSNNVFALVAGKPFAELPVTKDSNPRIDNSIRKFAAATVAISAEGINGACTGIRVSKNTIMTAAHCLYHDNKYYIDSGHALSITVYNPDTGNEQVITLGASEVKVSIPDLFKLCIVGEPEDFSSDIGIIEIANPTGILDNNNFINIRTPQQIVQSIPELNNYMFNPKTLLYAFGYGSHQHFEFATRATNTNTKSNTVFYYSPPYNASTDSWSYLLYDLNKHEAHPTSTYNFLNHMYEYNSSIPSYWEQFGGNGFAPYFTNTNVLLLSTMLQDKGVIYLQGGDSGGPLIACDASDNNKCSLIGIATNSLQDPSNSGYDVATTWMTTANPLTNNYLLK